jgi:hypothetical protein
MAHDVSFIDKDNFDNKSFYFFGYRGGIFYETFKANHLDNGVSGANAGVVRDRKTVLEGFERMNRTLSNDEQFKELYDNIKSCNYQTFVIWFS